MEYDYQMSLDGRSQILTATNPTQLQAVVGLPGLVGVGNNQGLLGGFTRQVAGQRPSKDPVVLSLVNLLGFASTTEKSGITPQQRLAELLTQSSSAAYDSVTGQYLGQAVHFAIGPDNVPLQQRCAERVWRVTTSPQSSKVTPDNFVNLTMEKDRTFSSRNCVGSGMQTGSTRAEVGLEIQKAPVKSKVSALLHSQFNVSAQDLEQKLSDGQDFPNSTNELALMGLYGNYTLIFDADELASFQLQAIADVLIRFDVLSVANTQETP
jgi:hypothetical protein